ncbi:glycoside hydrolase family 5 protein [Atractiella rhizophila]|nr:glycoside hydrolase family 5 protein [Atractiella rhizophila]
MSTNPMYKPTGGKWYSNPWVKWGVPVLVIAAIVGGVVGGVVGSKNSGSNKNVSGATAGNENGGSSSHSPSSTSAGQTSGATATGTSAAPSATASVTPVTRWDFSTNKMKRWMNEDWIIEKAGADAWDEWTFTSILGKDAALPILQDHWNTWITEDDIEFMHQSGINHLRIPVAFWHFIPTLADEPYLAMSGQIEQVERIMQYAYARGMYVLMDMHGLPGSQNGEQQSGHNTTDVRWYQDAYQQRTTQTIAAFITWMENTPYRSIISAFDACNEPRPYTDQQFTMLRTYYENTYQALKASSNPIPMMMAHGYPTDALNYWLEFVSAHVTTPPSLLYSDHPYPGNFPPQTDQQGILNQVCNDAKRYIGYPVPTCITEWSLYTGVKTSDFENQFYAAQVSTWNWLAGGTYWSYRVIPSKDQLAGGLDYTQYSFETLAKAGGVPLPTSATETPEAYFAGLTNYCGAEPATGSQNWPTVQPSAWPGTSSTKRRGKRQAFVA